MARTDISTTQGFNRQTSGCLSSAGCAASQPDFQESEVDAGHLTSLLSATPARRFPWPG